MTNDEALKFYKDEIDKYLRLKEALEQASIIVMSKAQSMRDSLLEAAEVFRREAEDAKFMYEETKIHIEKEK